MAGRRLSYPHPGLPCLQRTDANYGIPAAVVPRHRHSESKSRPDADGPGYYDGHRLSWRRGDFQGGVNRAGAPTAASIWITAAIGILSGIGFYFPLIVTTALTLGTLSIFRWIEAKMPNQFYARLAVKFQRDSMMSEDHFRRFVTERGFSIANLTYRYSAKDESFEYEMVIRTRDPSNGQILSEALCKTDTVQGFQLTPMAD